MITTRTLTSLAPTIALTTLASAGLSDMYITNGAGMIYSVDGNTLQATPVAQLDNAGSINDILYLGNGKILANLTFAMVTYDLNSGVQETLFTTNDEFGSPSSFTHSSGLARRANGDVYFTINEILNPSGLDVYGISYNEQTGNLHRVGDVDVPGAFDFYELANGDMIGFGSTGQSVLFDPDTGVVEATFGLDVVAVSFVQSIDDLFVVAIDGSMYTFDITDGPTEFYGQITGIEKGVLGASIANSSAALIPAPASLLTISGGMYLGLRRRRKN